MPPRDLSLNRFCDCLECSHGQTCDSLAINSHRMFWGRSTPEMYRYPPLKKVRETLNVKWYRCPVGGGTLKKLMERDDTLGFLQAGGHLALWVMTGWLTFHCWVEGTRCLLLVACVSLFVLSPLRLPSNQPDFG